MTTETLPHSIRAQQMFRYVPACFILIFSMNSVADLRVKSAHDACTLLTDSRLRAGEWTSNENAPQSCSSPARPVAAAMPAGSRISFSAQGNDDIPRTLKLVVDVLSAEDEEHAKRELVKTTKRLSVRALGLSIPFPLEESIMKGKPAQLAIGTGTITVTRTKGIKGQYQLMVTLE
jgi:hypothetical protein